MRHLFSSDLERLRILPRCSDIYESSLKDNRSSALPLPYRPRIDNSMLRSRSYLPITPISLPHLSYQGSRRSIFDQKIVNSPHSLMMKSSSDIQQHNDVPQQQGNCYDDDIMGLCYRFLPFQPNYINSEFIITKKIKDRLTKICNSLGLSYNSVPFSVPELFTYSRKGSGMLSLVNNNFDKVLVEVLSFYKGYYGRFILLVSLGVSCTVWYMFAPGIADIAPPSELLGRVLSYEPFFQVDHHYDKFNKVCFLERKYLTGEVLSALDNEYPFTEINIPASSNVRVAVGLGVMVAVFLALGIVPNVSSFKEIQR